MLSRRPCVAALLYVTLTLPRALAQETIAPPNPTPEIQRSTPAAPLPPRLSAETSRDRRQDSTSRARLAAVRHPQAIGARTSQARYYLEYKSLFGSTDGLDHRPIYGSSAPLYDNWHGSSNGGGYGSYTAPLISGSFQGGLGAGAGGGIGPLAAGS